MTPSGEPGKPPGERHRLAKVLVGLLGIALIGWLLWQSPLLRETAADGLGHLGSISSPVLASLACDEDARVRLAARAALIRVGPAAVPSLTRQFHQKNAEDRRQIIFALKLIGAEAQAAIPLLIDATQDENEEVRMAAVRALGSVGPGNREVVAALIGALKHGTPLVRASVPDALKVMGPEAREAVPALREALKDPDENVRSEAAEALEELDRSDGEGK